MSRLESVKGHILMLAPIIQSEVFGGTGDDTERSCIRSLQRSLVGVRANKNKFCSPYGSWDIGCDSAKALFAALKEEMRSGDHSTVLGFGDPDNAAYNLSLIHI